MAKDITKVHALYLVSADLAPDVVANLQCKPNDLGCESASRLLPSTSPSPLLLLRTPEADNHFAIPRRVEG